MNGVEFLFALSSVATMTMLHFLWIRLAYKIENGDKKAKQKTIPNFAKHERVDDIIDYDGMGQGRSIPKNRR